MRAGEVLANRFEVERLAGSGGMGTVYRARDRDTGEPVAVKLLSRGGEDRFLREARVLAELRHPAIVRYVAHGQLASGEPYLAMEWLEGEDLAARLARAALSEADSLAIVARAAHALSAAHARNVVHRDIKPGNLFLVEGDPSKLKVVDFGLAHLDHASRAATATGMLLGTPGYMAPEQASGERVDARTDVFALGCVLFECLAGRPVFVAQNARALLTKILLEDPPALRDVAPAVHASLDRVVTRMLQKRPELRYADAAAVTKVLDALLRGEPDASSATVEAPVERMWDERHIASVIMAATPRPQASFGGSTVQPEAPQRSLLETTAERFGAKVAWVRDGTVVATVNVRGTAVDQAVTTARFALALRKALPKTGVVVATGRADVSGRIPMGEVIERATNLLSSQTGALEQACVVDDVTRALVESRFHVVKSAAGAAHLVGERHALEVARPLLGRPTPCVGRDKELALLEATFRECTEDGVRRAVLVTAPAGYGKTRLAQELLAQVRRDTEPCVLVARGDPIGAGTTLGMARQLVRGTSRWPAEPLVEALRRTLLVEEDGEADGSPPATQGDPRAVLERIRQGFARWIAVVLAERPGLFVLDDLHWGDPETASLLADAFRAPHQGPPCMLLALARPEGLERFGDLRAIAQEVRLEALTRRASERLVTHVLGELPNAGAHRIVERAEGNAFYLEELIRCLGEGRGEAVSEPVLALAQARVEALDPHARRLLRAASIFGDRFSAESVAALVGDAADPADVEQELEGLVRREMLAVAPPAAYAFRHAMVRDAVYAMVTEADRAAAHRLAGEWLETHGEHDPVVMAEHYERGAAIDKTVHWLTRAAQAALHRGNFEAASLLAKRGLGYRAEDDALLSTLWEVSVHTSQWKQLGELLERDLPLLGVDNPRRFVAEAVLTHAAFGTPLGDSALEKALKHLPTRTAPGGEIGPGVHFVLVALAWRGRGADAERVLEHCEALVRDDASADPTFVAYLKTNTCHPVSLYVTNDLGRARASADEAFQRFEQMKDLTNSSVALHALTQAQLLAGQLAHAEATARKQLEHSWFKELSTMWLAAARLGLGAPDEALQLLRSIEGTGSVLNQTRARVVRCETLVALGRLEEARTAAEELLAANDHAPMFAAGALSVLADVAMRQARPIDALQHCERGVELCTRHPRNPGFESTLRLVQVEALIATGSLDRAIAALRAARDRLLRIRATLTGDEARDAYLQGIAANARTMELAADLLSSVTAP
ncbi:MAG TPA: protein kinase [Polyangiaceae bacterium]